MIQRMRSTDGQIYNIQTSDVPYYLKLGWQIIKED